MQKEKWNQNFIDQTSTTASAAERTMSFVDHEVLVDNRTGKKMKIIEKVLWFDDVGLGVCLMI